jgi:hypothetical protein
VGVDSWAVFDEDARERKRRDAVQATARTRRSQDRSGGDRVNVDVGSDPDERADCHGGRDLSPREACTEQVGRGAKTVRGIVRRELHVQHPTTAANRRFPSGPILWAIVDPGHWGGASAVRSVEYLRPA